MVSSALDCRHSQSVNSDPDFMQNSEKVVFFHMSMDDYRQAQVTKPTTASKGVAEAYDSCTVGDGTPYSFSKTESSHIF